jgi:hypothetical protein
MNSADHFRLGQSKRILRREKQKRARRCVPFLTGSRGHSVRELYGANLGAGALGEAGDGGCFGVIDIEDREQLRDLQYFLELAA